ncbi:hypothetical protein VNO77_39249 [Canavalia gladiata]|uniref:Uncharacterized protein n=1 Tax=Canavalia gladiata TaxID=3824 RepID=A0AAN9KCB4_CANGL
MSCSEEECFSIASIVLLRCDSGCGLRTRMKARVESLERGIEAWKEELETRNELQEARLKRIEELLKGIFVRQQQTNPNGVDGDQNSIKR